MTTCVSTQGPRNEDTTPIFPQRSTTPPYAIRDSTRIHALESTV
ncbi:hypothetical protein M758_N018400 [Ceratodon purpureus]|nr:hypothetical protein M758_N018400 [Ceratodon purpureus]